MLPQYQSLWYTTHMTASHDLTVNTYPGRLSTRERHAALESGIAPLQPVPTRSYVSCSCGWEGPAYFESPEEAAQYGWDHVERKAKTDA